MNKRQKEVLQHQLDAEKEILDKLTKQYQRALWDIDIKIRVLQSDELTQSRIYRIEYQKVLKKQVEAILEKLHADEYTTIQQFLSDTYTDAFVGTAYDMFGQGVPLIMPIDRNAAVKAVVTDSKISEGLYEALGVDTKKLKNSISAEITRGIASGLPHSQIARNISESAKAPLGRAKTIVRTESHRIAQASAMDAQKVAVSKGAKVVKQWMSTLDGDTRKSHRKLDGQIREVDEPFEMDGKKAMYPGDFGDPAEDCNCRCQVLQRARLALDEDELKTLQERAKFFGLDKTDDLEDFKKKYLKAAETVEIEPENYQSRIENTKTIKELQDTVKHITGKDVDLTGTDLELMKKNMVQIADLSKEYGVHFDAIETTAARKYLGEVARSGRYGDKVTLLYPKKYYKSREALIEELRKTASTGNMPRIGGRSIDVYSTTHEFAHTLSSGVTSRLYGKDTDFWDEIEDIYKDYKKNGNGILGKYASSNQDEFLAEAFADAKLGARPSKWSEETLAIIDKYFKKNVEKSSENGIIKLGNVDVRKWYKDSISKIPDSIDKTLPIEEQARQAFEARNRIRTEAREMMADEAKRKELDKDKPNKTFEELIEYKMKSKGLTREEAIEDILKTATKSNANVDRELGLGDG